MTRRAQKGSQAGRCSEIAADRNMRARPDAHLSTGGHAIRLLFIAGLRALRGLPTGVRADYLLALRLCLPPKTKKAPPTSSCSCDPHRHHVTHSVTPGNRLAKASSSVASL